MTAQIVWDDPFNPPATGTVERPFTLVGQTIDIYNFDDTGVLAWRWDLLDRPLGSAAVLSSTIAAAIQITPDIPGAYFLRLRTYSDLAALVLDDADEQIFGIAFGTPFDWQVPAAGETTQRGSRGWATPREYAIRQTQTYVAGGLQTAFAQQPTVELGGGVLAVTQAGSPVLRLDGSVGRARIPDGTLAQPGLSFIADAASGLRMSSAGKWNLVASGVSMIDFSPGAVVMGERTYVPDGTALLPGLAFSTDADVGLYRIAANTLGVAAGGALQLAVSTTRVDANVPFAAFAGSAANPHYEFGSDLTTGMFLVAPGVLGFSVSGTERARFTSTGGLLTGNWLPSADLTHNLGDPSFRWNNLWAGSATFSLGLFADGTAVDPSISFTADTNTGLWRAGSGIVGVTGDGLEVVRFQAPAGVNPQAVFALGAAGFPSIGFTGRANQGFFSSSSVKLALGLDQTVSNMAFTRVTGHSYALDVEGASATGIGLRAATANAQAFVQGRVSSNALASFDVSQVSSQAFTGGAAIQQYGARFTYVLNQTSTALFDALRVDLTNTAIGSGDQNIVALTIGGAAVFKIKNSTTASAQGQLQAADGAAATPSYSFLNDSNTGFFSAAADSIGVSTQGVEFWRFNNQTLSGFQSNSVIAAPSAVGRLTLRGNIQNAAQGVVTFESTSAWIGGAGVAQTGIELLATLNQTSTAGFTGLRLALTHTAIGSGTHRFVDFTIGGTTHYAVTAGNTPGRVHANDGAVATPSYSFLGETGLGWWRVATGQIGFAVGGGTPIQLNINGIQFNNAAQYLITTAANGALTYYGNITSSTTGVAHNVLNNASFAASSGTQKLARFAGTMNQSATAAYTGVEIDITETTTGSGAKRLLDLKVGGTTLSYVDNGGRFYGPDGSVSLPTYSFVSDTNSGFYSAAGDVIAVTLGGTARWQFSGDELRAQGASGGIRQNASDAGLTYTGNVSASTSAPVHNFLNGTQFSASSGVQKGMQLAFGISQTGTAGLTLLEIQGNVVGGTGSGVYNLIDAQFGSTQFRVTSTGRTYMGDGDAALPGISFQGDTDTGIYRSASNEVAFTAGGTGRVKLTTTTLEPITDNAMGLGTASKRYTTLYSVALNTGDIVMRDPTAPPDDPDAAHWRLVEGKDTIYAYNVRTRRKYRIAMVEEQLDDADAARLGA